MAARTAGRLLGDSLLLGTIFLIVVSGVSFSAESPSSLHPPQSGPLLISKAAPVAPSLPKPLTPAAALGPDDWPMYLFDPEHVSTNPNDTVISAANASSLSLSWATNLSNVGPIGSVIAAAPDVVGDTVYVGTWDGNLSAINATTGQRIWERYLGQTNVTNCNSPRGITSSAAIVDGTVYVGGGGDYWYALNAATGAIEWKILVGNNSNTGGNYNWASPVIYGGYEYIGVASDCDKPLVRGELMQVSLSTHLPVNVFYTVPTGKLGGTIWTTPTIDPSLGLMVIATGNCKGNNYNESPYCGGIVALNLSNISQGSCTTTCDSNGVKGVWQDVGCGNQTSNDDCDLPTSPAIFVNSHGTPMVEAGDKSGNMYTLNLSSPAMWHKSGPVWTTRIASGDGNIEKGGGLAATAVWDGKFLIDAGQEHKVGTKVYWGSIAALYPDNGTIAWQTPLPYSQTTFGAVTYENGAIIEGGAMVDTSSPSYNGTLFVLNATNGKILWQYGTPGLFYGSATVADGHIFIGNFLGTLYSFGLSHTVTINSFVAQPSTITIGAGTQFHTGVSGGSGVYSYSYAGLPAGCSSLNSSTLDCSPTVSGTFTVTVTVTDTLGASQDASTGLTVNSMTEYSVTFSETGLPSGTSWSVTLNGVLMSTTTPSIVFSESDGTYTYSVGAVSGYAASPTGGSLTVSGTPLVKSITWTKNATLYSVTFKESGLPAGTLWNVTAGSPPVLTATTTTSIGFQEPAGTLLFTIGSPIGYGVSHTSSVLQNATQVKGKDTVTITFKGFQTVTFTETGLPSGSKWSVDLTAKPLSGGPPAQNISSTTNKIVFVVVKGAYNYSVALPVGFKTSHPTGSFYAGGSQVKESVVTTATDPVTASKENDLPGPPAGSAASPQIPAARSSS